ncbi:MAG TPA: pseudouridine synthase [Bacteroidota bacterium]|nr:pseudouridine synthase [Bacteroidota bacterium]
MKTSRAPGRVTLPRALSKLGIASRSQAMILIEQGRVGVNGRTERNQHRWIDIESDVVTVNDQAAAEKLPRYLVLNKPRGFVTTTSDERGASTVYELVGEKGAGLSPVGRLDKDSTGLLMFTNDHQLANALTSPGSGLFKTYRVQMDAPLSERGLLMLMRGMDIEIRGDLHRTKPAHVTQISPGVVEISIAEGRNRQLRRMMEALGHEVVSLKRISIGPLSLGDLKEGECRELAKAEVDALKQAVRPSPSSQQKIYPVRKGR